MTDVLLGIRLLRILDTTPEGRLTPREAIRRLAMNYASDYFQGVSISRLRTILEGESQDGNEFFQHVRDVRMDLAYRGLVGLVSPRGRLEGRWFITQRGHDWLAGVWQGDDVSSTAIRLPPRRADWRDQIPVTRVDSVEPSEDVSEDVIDLDSIDPRKFEELLGNILMRMGWRATVTQYSQDGGIDIDAVNPAPIAGGRVLVQCKRRRASIGVATIRELYGVVMAQQATKGVIVTTGTFSKAAMDFAENRPLELIDRQNLLAILRQHGFKTPEHRVDTSPQVR